MSELRKYPRYDVSGTGKLSLQASEKNTEVP